MTELSGLPYGSAIKVPDGTNERTNERTQLTNDYQDQGSNRLVPNTPNPVDNRIKVACINWPHPDAPHAMSYLLRDGVMVGETYHATWDEAMERADEVASRLRQVVAS